MTAPDISLARSVALGLRLSPEWQDEESLLKGLAVPEHQLWLVRTSGLAQRRRLGGTRRGVPIRWQLRLAGGEAPSPAALGRESPSPQRERGK